LHIVAVELVQRWLRCERATTAGRQRQCAQQELSAIEGDDLGALPVFDTIRPS
jgi:hypothetical protein